MRSKRDSAVAKQAHGSVPRLRFPSVSGSSIWKRKRLGQFCKVNPSADALPAEFFYIDLGSVDAGVLKSKQRTSKLNAPSRAQRVLQNGDVLFQAVRPYQRNNFFFDLDDGVYVASTGYAQLRSEQSPRFLYQLVHTEPFIERVLSKCTGSNYPAINSSDLEDIEIDHPKEDEQQKIADCLSSLDTNIAAESHKLLALKAHKKGLMQQLFPAEGQRLPRLRFPGFGEDWQEVRLGDIAEIKLGKMLDGKKHAKGLLLPYLNNISVRWNDVDTSNLPRMYFRDEELDGFRLNTGDVVVCEGGEPGRSAVWDGSLPEVKFQKAIHRVRFNVPFEPSLLVHFLEAIAGTPRLEKLFTGGGIRHLTLETFARLATPLPSYMEQQRIAEFLSSLNVLIAAQSRRLTALRQHKKGLMQGLFPAVDAHPA
jgi:type I restriction enzyme S subunit